MLAPHLAAYIWLFLFAALHFEAVFPNDFVSRIIGDVTYLVEQSPVYALNVAEGASFDIASLIPVTFAVIDSSAITGGALARTLESYAIIDDVWTPYFQETVIASTSDASVLETACLDETSKMWPHDIGAAKIYLSGCAKVPPPEPQNVSTITYLPNINAEPGPYLLHAQHSSIALFKVYRLYPDILKAFVYGIIPTKSGWDGVNSPPGDSFVPVPSKLYTLRSSLPLAGKRFALKDIFDVEGLQTYAGSFAYGEVSPLAARTASSVQRLLDLGAVLVGKTKTSQFAHGANPWQFIDFSYPWNPRGDGYLTAASSSSGSACAIAGYEWLDFAVGSDTRGSVRKPAALVGVYGIRPSTGIMDLDGVVPLAEEMDTAGVFARDPQLFYESCKHWYPGLDDDYGGELPTKLLYPVDHFPVTNPQAQVLFDSFVSRLVDQLGFTKTLRNLTSQLLTILPNANFTELQVHSNVLAEYHSYHKVAKPLIKNYRDIHGPRVYPQFDTIPTIVFDRARDYEKQDYEKALRAKEAFTRAVSQHIIQSNPSSCSDSILIYDIGFGGLPSYRFKEYNDLPGAAHLFLNSPAELHHISDGLNYISSTAGLPEITVPLGEIPYLSHVTGEVHMLPVSVQMVAHKGCDGILLHLLRIMYRNGISAGVRTGKSLIK